MAAGHGARHAMPLFVELVGPAGAGKSTLASALAERDPRFVPGLTLWKRPRRDLARSAFALAPTVAAAALAGRPVRPRELAQMIRVEALRLGADRALAPGWRVHVIDEGPVFGLAWLEVFFGRHDAAFTRWRHAVLRDWSARLGAVIRLDADDEVLARRIRARPQAHPVKADPDRAIASFIARYRRAFDRVLAELRAAGPVPVVDLRTDRSPDEQAAASVHGALEETLHGR
jgi:hypothetical protein